MDTRDGKHAGMIFSDNVTEIGHLTRIACFYPHVIRLGHFEKAAFIPKRQIENTQICIQTYSTPVSPDLLIDGKYYSVSCPRVLIKRCGEIHEIPVQGNVSSFYFVYAPGSGIEKMLPQDLVCNSLILTSHLQTLIGQATDLCRSTGDFGVCDRIDECCFAMLQEIVLSLAVRNNPPKETGQKIGQILSWLQHHYCEPVNWEDLALQFGFSERSFLRHWQKNMTCSPKEYIIKLRFARAENMLSDSHLKISEIAAKIGYGSTESFINAFRKRYGLSPLAYRKRFWLQ